MTNNLDVFSSLMKEQIRGSLSDACAVIMWLYKFERGEGGGAAGGGAAL